MQAGARGLGVVGGEDVGAIHVVVSVVVVVIGIVVIDVELSSSSSSLVSPS